MRSAVNALAGVTINNRPVLRFLPISISHRNQRFLLPEAPPAVSAEGAAGAGPCVAAGAGELLPRCHPRQDGAGLSPSLPLLLPGAPTDTHVAFLARSSSLLFLILPTLLSWSHQGARDAAASRGVSGPSPPTSPVPPNLSFRGSLPPGFSIRLPSLQTCLLAVVVTLMQDPMAGFVVGCGVVARRRQRVAFFLRGAEGSRAAAPLVSALCFPAFW